VSQSIVQSLRRWDPDWIGPFAIVGRLGAGAMGQVYLARSTAGRLVAVKTIRVELAEEPGFRARFAREVAAARRVSGVFTAAVVEADPEADLPWLATAYVPAPSLNTLVRRCGPLPVPAVRWLAAGCAEALQSIHNAGLLHRDVKPSNVLVAPDGPRVIDFGVARAAERVQLTVTRGAPGTPAYMAPEQARDSSQASPASDVFSLGATLVFAATGHAPYRGEAVMDILVRLATEPPDLDGVPPELTELVAACLQRVPRDRPTTGAILTRLGPFAAASEQASTGHSYLPDAAMALIAEYQPNPRLAGRAGADTDGEEVPGEDTDDGSGASSAPGDDTSGSHTALPGYDSVVPASGGQSPPSGGRRRRLPAPWGSGRAAGRGDDAWPAVRAGARPARRRPLVWAAAAVAALVLIGAGTAIGMSLRDSGTPAAGDPQTIGVSSCLNPGQTSTPQLCVSQPYGDGYTAYVIHGSGFAPFTQVTVRLVGVGVSAYHPVADMQGTFNYAIDQGHYFFTGPIPPRSYTVVVTGSGGRTASASFLVHPPGTGPPPGVPPGTP
jgi:serine/threonine protein kinase